MITIGVLAIQGAISEHVTALKRTKNGAQCNIVAIKKGGTVPECDGLVIPGGESTTISHIMRAEGIDQEILDNADMPIMGTCAGLIVLSRYKDAEVAGLNLMNINVKRNAFGRQVDSFELPLQVTLFDSAFEGIFIRAPVITTVGEGVDVLSRVESFIVAAQQKNKLGLAFHPELSNDVRFHSYFVDLVNNSC
ncbi:MAG: pyridoxal 5'-phosphate synthase glutaminase subunit PdxT [Halobacteriota archaeon]